jgi:hypothetical protein
MSLPGQLRSQGRRMHLPVVVLLGRGVGQRLP